MVHPFPSCEETLLLSWQFHPESVMAGSVVHRMPKKEKMILVHSRLLVFSTILELFHAVSAAAEHLETCQPGRCFPQCKVLMLALLTKFKIMIIHI